MKNSRTKNTEVMDEFGRTKLILACEEGNFDSVKSLVDNGAAINVYDRFDTSPLQTTLNKYDNTRDPKYISIMTYLIDHGADVNCTDGYCHSLLMRVLGCDVDIQFIKYLLDHGADVNLESDFGETALLCAVARENIEIITLLIHYGALVYECVVDSNFNTRNIEIIKLLISLGAQYDSVLFPEYIQYETRVSRFIKDPLLYYIIYDDLIYMNYYLLKYMTKNSYPIPEQFIEKILMEDIKNAKLLKSYVIPLKYNCEDKLSDIENIDKHKLPKHYK